jgi:hypothetical protein
MSLGQRASDAVCRVAFRGGWGARLARLAGLQPPPVTRTHVVAAHRRVPGAPTLRIAFAADFHAGDTTHPALLAEACARLAETRPDVVLFGGDFVGHAVCEVEALVPHLAELTAPLGKFAVFGNHDLLDDDARLAERLEWAGVRVLTNRAERLGAPHDDVWVCGLDDPIIGDPDAALALDGTDGGARVVLMHAPDGLLALGDAEFELALCGHTHGGQITLPGGIRPVLPAGRLSGRFPEGEYALGEGQTLLVSRGVGCTGVPMRFLAWPEVHVCELRAANAARQP